MIRSTSLNTTAKKQSVVDEIRDEGTAKHKRKNAVPEYALLLALVLMAAGVNYLNLMADDQDKARAFAAKYYRNGNPTPDYKISTPMRKETVIISGISFERHWFFNDDSTMRYVDVVPPSGAEKIGYLRNEVVYTTNRRRKAWQKTDVLEGDNGRPASFVSFDYQYTTDSDYTVSVVSGVDGGWRWTHHIDTYVNDQISHQIIYDKNGHGRRRTFATHNAVPVTEQKTQ